MTHVPMRACVYRGLGGWRGGDLEGLLVTCLLRLPEERILVTFANTIAYQHLMFPASETARHVSVYLAPDSEKLFKKERKIYPFTPT